MNTATQENTVAKVLKSDADVRKLKAPANGQQDYATEFPGLQLRHFPSDLKCWFIRARIKDGKAVFVKLGEFPAVNLNAAQLACSTARDILRRGVNPNDEAKADAAAERAQNITFGTAAEEWIAERCGGKKPWRATTAEKVRFVLLGGRLKPWKDRLLGAIEDEDVKAALESLDKNSEQTFLAPIRGLFKWAVRKGYVEKSPVVGIFASIPDGDQAPLIGFEEGGKDEEPTLDFAEMVAFLQCLEALQASLPLSPWPSIYRLGLLTGARYSEVVGLPRAEVDLAKAVWTLPASRSKLRKECKRPLSAAAVELLRAVPGEGALFFPGKIQGHSLTKTGREPSTLSTMMKDRGFPAGFWYGRLRDTVASWLDFQTDATERAMAIIMNHKPPSNNVRRRNYVLISGMKQARALLERWATTVQHVKDGTAAKVVAGKFGVRAA